VPVEVELVRAAVAAVDLAAVSDPEFGRVALSEGLLIEGTARQEEGEDLGALLVSLTPSPPEIVAFSELVEDLDRRRMGRRGMEDRMRSVFGITKVLGSSRETAQLMRLALEEARQIVGAASASVERWERDTNQLRCLVSVGELGPGEETFPADELYALADYTQVRRTMLTGLPYIHRVDDPATDDDAVAVLQAVHKYSSAAVPIYVDGRIWGQLWFATDYGEPHFEAQDIERLMAVATLMGGVVAQAENLRAVDRMAFEDGLTHVGNRRLVDDVLEQLAAGGERTVIALLDIDRLKEINDERGHAAGDVAIRLVADTLSVGVVSWPHATIGRLGGDEFCVVLPGCTLAEAGGLMQETVRRLEEAGGPRVSLGIATAGDGSWSPRDLLGAADEELYRAKRQAHGALERSNGRRAPQRRRARRDAESSIPL
jgi:diguanylate cyclase (GGDEF)-like protein